MIVKYFIHLNLIVLQLIYTSTFSALNWNDTTGTVDKYDPSSMLYTDNVSFTLDANAVYKINLIITVPSSSSQQLTLELAYNSTITGTYTGLARYVEYTAPNSSTGNVSINGFWIYNTATLSSKCLQILFKASVTQVIQDGSIFIERIK